MITQYDFTRTGGMPLTQTVLADMQANEQELIAALAALVGDKVILAGMQEVAGQVLPGWFSFGGKLVRFGGGPILPRVVLQEEVRSLLYADGQTKQVVTTTTATTGTVGGFAYAELRRIGSLADLYAGMVPTGLISMWSGTVPPAGWALCDGGGSPPRPDLRSRFIVGYNPTDPDYATIGNIGGAKQVTLTALQMPPHNHSMSLYRNDSRGGDQANTAYLGNDTGAVPTTAVTDYTGGGEPHENRPPYYTLAFIIKL
jgi:microcystin-dependent protein